MNTQTGHLSDEQWALVLSEDAQDNEIERHLRDCAKCRTEQENLRVAVAAMRGQIRVGAHRPAAFWSWQLQSAMAALHGRRMHMIPALASTLALLAVALLLLRFPPRPAAPGRPSDNFAAVAPDIAQAANSQPVSPRPQVRNGSASPFPNSHAVSPDDAELMAAVERALQGPPAALQPAALLAQELLSIQVHAVPDADSTNSKGELQ